MDLTDLARPKCLYTRRVQDLAVRLVCEDGLPYQTASWNLWRDHRVLSPSPRPGSGSWRRGKKVATRRTTYLDDALAQFSGYVAIDEVDDGPFCILSVVDNRRYNRLACCVLEHDPTHADVRIFRADVKGQLGARGKRVQGITTDGSSRYPAVLSQRWPGVPHPLCVFHILKEINQAVPRALTHVRKHVLAPIRTRKRGRPRKQDAAPARRMTTRQKADVAELFEHRRLTPPDAPKPFTASIGRGLRRDGSKIGRFHARNPNPCTLAAKVSKRVPLTASWRLMALVLCSQCSLVRCVWEV
ncbi:transposase [Gemmata obscuriglobus]|uniref:transposase n=1 Tax=Gemmata obscuriglobus TaxID=114 RepID=UPI0011CE6D16|nr:transposase [Gemmata obscuriglobus]